MMPVRIGVRLSSGIEERALTIRGFTVEPGNSNVVYLAGEISSWEWNNDIALPGLGLDRPKALFIKPLMAEKLAANLVWVTTWPRYIWIHPEDHNLIYVSTGIFDREAANSDPNTLEPGGVGILRSQDGGTTWQVLDESNGFLPNELYFGSLFMHPQNPAILLAAAGNDTYFDGAGRSGGRLSYGGRRRPLGAGVGAGKCKCC